MAGCCLLPVCRNAFQRVLRLAYVVGVSNRIDSRRPWHHTRQTELGVPFQGKLLGQWKRRLGECRAVKRHENESPGRLGRQGLPIGVPKEHRDWAVAERLPGDTAVKKTADSRPG